MNRIWILMWACTAALAVETPVIIDGSFEDPIWRGAVTTKLAPAEPGVPPELGGEIRVAVAGRYLYIGARLPEPSGRITARSMGRNPSWEEEDGLRVVVGPYPDYIVQVGPLGAYSVETKGQPVLRERFFAAALVKEREWTAEIAIPLNDLKPTRLDEIRMTIERVRAMRPGSVEQHWRWPEHEPAGKLPPGPPNAPSPVFRARPLGNQDPPLEAGRTRALPALDSRWDAAPWRDTPVWKLWFNDSLQRLPAHETAVKVLYSDQTLAVLARCAAPAGLGDEFDVYLATSGSAYAHFAIDSAGMLRQAVGMTGGQQVARPRTEWKSSARGVARKESGVWLARIDIPLAEVAPVLGELGPPPEWRVLLQRSRHAADGEPPELSVLPVTQSETPLCPARYRRLVLVDRAHAISDSQAAPPLVSGYVFSAEQRNQLALAGMVNSQLRARAIRVLQSEREEWDRVQTVADWERFRDPRIKALASSLGEFPTRAPLETRVTKVFPGNGYRREDLLFQSRPGLWVSANLYLPEKSHGPMPGIILTHSHHRPRNQPELQDMGILWARAGTAVLIPDQIGAGERIQNYPWNREPYHSRYIMGMQLHLIGESLIKWMVWDTMREVDLLLERKDVDPKQIVLIGAVAGGGDPAAVTAALDPRIAAVVPFNFGEASPENTRFVPEKNRWPLELADPGWGAWETTRNLRGSIVGQFFPWLICASVAPRRFAYSFEMGWKVEDMPAWARYQHVFDLYQAKENLSEAHGFGPYPGPGECTNIGPIQRRSLYPTLTRWFGIPPPQHEPEDRRPASELNALTPVIATGLHARSVHDLAAETGRAQIERARAQLAKLTPAAQREWLRIRWTAKLGDIEPNRQAAATLHWKKPIDGGEAEGISLEVEPGIVVPLLLLKPQAGTTRTPVVIAVSEHGKYALLAHRRADVMTLLRKGVTICLPEVRGTGETAPDWRRGPLNAEISLASSELMLGQTLLGARLKDLRAVLAFVRTRPETDPNHIALWGEGLTPPNPDRIVLDELPNWQIGPQIQQQAEPLGGLLALLGALFDKGIRSVAVEGGLDSYLSILDDQFAYVPADIIIPGILDGGDIGDVAKALAPQPVLLENMRDGRNRVVGHAVQNPQPAEWLLAHM